MIWIAGTVIALNYIAYVILPGAYLDLWGW